MKKMFLAIILFATVLSVHAQETTTVIETTGLDAAPPVEADSIFYPFHRFGEFVEEIITFDAHKKAELKLKFAERRLKESRSLLLKGKIEDAQKIMQDYKVQITAAKEQGTDALKALIVERQTKHLEAIQAIKDNTSMPLENKTRINDLIEKNLKGGST